MSMINNALTGSVAAQVALNATSQNIANLQTKGYTRQGAVLSALPPDGSVQSVGNGVAVSSLQRFSDTYKSQQMWRAASSLGQHEPAQPYLTQLERVMGDDESSLSTGIDNFFKSLNAAAVDPTSSPLRQQVVSAADAMAQRFNSITNVVDGQLLSVQQQRAALLPQANETIASIAHLNQKINDSAAGGANTSALVDARDQAIDSLAGMMAIDVGYQPDGSRSVSLKSGPALVVGARAAVLSGSVTDGVENVAVTFASTTFKLDNTVGGQLGGLGDLQQNVLTPLRASIADIARQVAQNVNAVLAAGYKMDGSLGASGPDLFAFDPNSGARLLQVNAGYQAADLAFSADANPGNSDNLKKLVLLNNQPIDVTLIGSVMIGDADTQLVGKLAIDSQRNQALLSTADTVRNQSVESWQSTSGVNKDEEAVNLIEFQNMYQANMKVISVANTLFDATLAMMG